MKEFQGISVNEVIKAYKFAQDMRGAHNNNLIMERTPKQIFIDDFRGKIAEIATKRYLEQNGHLVNNLDFERYERGEWDRDDIVMDDSNHISVKSSGKYANYLMIETHRFDEYGNYSYKNNDDIPINIDYYVFLNVDLGDESEDGFTEYVDGLHFLGVDNEYARWDEVGNARRITCYIRGFISHEDFWNQKKIAYRGIKANKTNLDSIWNGDEVRPDTAFINNDRNWLQKDNYIIKANSLLRLF